MCLALTVMVVRRACHLGGDARTPEAALIAAVHRSMAMKTPKSGVLALVPARGGSKRLPRKNLYPIAGRPLLAWTIDAARASLVFDRILVSTDDQEIGLVARQCGAEVPFLRPPQLAGDAAASIDLVLHALDWLDTHEAWRPHLVMLLQPTSPLRTAEDIRGAIAEQRASGAEAVVSVRASSRPRHWLHRMGPGGVLLSIMEGPVPTQHGGERLYELNGAIYLATPAVLRRERGFLPPGTVGYVMPEERSLDIDTAWDALLADLILRNRQMADPS